MDYAPLVKAIQEGDQEEADRLISVATPILIRMLEVRMNASREDAEDAVQTMFLSVIKAIKKDSIRKPSGLHSYMMVSCRNNYLKTVNGRKTGPLDALVKEPSHEPVQQAILMDAEKMRIYEECIRSLKSNHRTFFSYWVRHPDSSASEIAEHFGISVNNAWTRKHRIIKILRKCIESKY